MAYSDYGGKAYRDGVWREDRSDCVILPTEELFSSPGLWPGFAALLEGKTAGEAADIANSPSGHAVLGDGPIYLVLYKQSSVRVYRGFDELEFFTLLDSADQEALLWFEDTSYIDDEQYRNIKPLIFSVDGCQITIYWTYEDNYYVYAQLIQPDGTCWQGWSGYRVGIGFDEREEDYSSADRDETLRELFSKSEET